MATIDLCDWLDLFFCFPDGGLQQVSRSSTVSRLPLYSLGLYALCPPFTSPLGGPDDLFRGQQPLTQVPLMHGDNLTEIL